MKRSSTNKVFIFCQGAADIPYSLQLYESHKNSGARVHIVVVNVYANFQFLKSLNLDSDLTFIPCGSLKNPFKLIWARFVLARYRNMLNPGADDTVYFFSVLHDYVTSYLVEKFKRISKVILIDHYGHRPQASQGTLVSKVILFFACKILNTELKFSHYQGQRFYFSPLSYELGTIPSIRHDHLKKYLYSPKIADDKHRVLFFETNSAKVPYFTNYESEISAVLDWLTSRFTVYLKGHPRLGVSEVVSKNKSIILIPEYVPGELIDLDGFDFILGIDTTVLGHLALSKQNVFSLLPMFSIENEARKYLIDYLNRKSEGRLTYIERVDELPTAD